MDIDRPNALPLTPEEFGDLEDLKGIVEKITADGVLTFEEEQLIKRTLWKDGKISPQELEIVRSLVWNKLQSGELTSSW